MKKSFWLFIIITSIFTVKGYTQFSRYIIQLKDKSGSSFSTSNPSLFLSQRAIDRRVRYNIPLAETDLPVNSNYIQSILGVGNVSVLNVSKWFNQVCILTTDPAAITRINALPFVKTSTPIAARGANFIKPVNKFSYQINPAATTSFTARPQSPVDNYDYGRAYPQIHLHNGEFLHNHGFRGEGMQLAIMDGGFLNYLTLPTFDSVRKNNQVLGTWDFVANKISVNEEHPHGMNCFSTIAANMPGTFIGTAPKASFYLFRTEDILSEYPVEEQNFTAAAERADSLGVDVLSVSLGYNTFDNSLFNYTYADMNGQKTLIAKAVNMAAQKGIAVVVAAGNEGNNAWHYLVTPADADSALTVGAVNVNRQIASFSSYGPNSDGQIKPDVAAVGAGAIIANNTSGLPTSSNGTSFACPILAGITTNLWQAFPEVNNMAIIEVLRKSADHNTAPDNRTGYGIPDVKKAFVLLQKKSYTQQIAIDNNCKTVLQWSVKTAADMQCVIERKLSSSTDFTVIDSQFINTGFAKNDFIYLDDLSSILPGSTIQYRIKMNIAADTSYYLDSATVFYQKSCVVLPENIVTGPNPVTGNLSVIINRNSQVKVSLIMHNSIGQLVYSLNNQPLNGEQTFTIPMQPISKGTYYLTVIIDGKKVTTKKIIRN